MADLDDAVVRIDAHQRLPAFGPTGGPVDDGEEEGIGTDSRLGDPGIEVLPVRLRGLRQVSEPLLDSFGRGDRGEETEGGLSIPSGRCVYPENG